MGLISPCNRQYIGFFIALPLLTKSLEGTWTFCLLSGCKRHKRYAYQPTPVGLCFIDVLHVHSVPSNTYNNIVVLLSPNVLFLCICTSPSS